MSNWEPEKSFERTAMNPDLEWKVKVKTIDDTLKKMKQETDNTSQKFIWVKSNSGSYEVFQTWTHKITLTSSEVMKNIDSLLKMMPKNRDMEYSAKNNQVKQLTKRAEIQIKHIQNLSSEIQKEMEKQYLNNKMRASVVSEGALNNSEARNSDQYQMSAMEDPQLQLALEEERQCQKLLQDVSSLQDIFVKLGEMVHEQGEVVDAIHANVEEAYEKNEEGYVELSKAVEHKVSASKKKLCLIGVVVIVVVVLIIVIVVAVKLG